MQYCFCLLQQGTTYLLERPSRNWSHYKNMELAAQCYCYHFMGSVACQQAVNYEWRAGVNAEPILLVLAFIMPPLILAPCFTFTQSRNDAHLEDLMDPFVRLSKRLPCHCCVTGDKDGDVKVDANGWSIVPWHKKAFMFYRSPRTKFVAHSVSAY